MNKVIELASQVAVLHAMVTRHKEAFPEPRPLSVRKTHHLLTEQRRQAEQDLVKAARELSLG